MNPLEKYLTHSNSSYREFAKMALNSGEPEKYKIIEEANYIPDEYTFAEQVIIHYRRLKEIQQRVIYCESLNCSVNSLTELPELPFCKYLWCYNNNLTELPQLSRCERLICQNNKITQLPELPNCEELYCSHNKITELPQLPKCEILDCVKNNLNRLPDLPECRELFCGNNHTPHPNPDLWKNSNLPKIETINMVCQ